MKADARDRALARRLNTLAPLEAEMREFCDVGERFTYLGVPMLVTNIRVDMDQHLKGVPGNVVCACDYRAHGGSIMQSQFGYEMLEVMKLENGR